MNNRYKAVPSKSSKLNEEPYGTKTFWIVDTKQNGVVAYVHEDSAEVIALALNTLTA